MGKDIIITVDIGASKIRFMSVSHDKELTEYADTPQVSLIGLSLDNEKLFTILSENIQRSIENVKKEGNTAVAISIGSPGSLDGKKEVILNIPNLKDIRDFKIVDHLRQAFNLPVFLLNDADMAMFGELWLREHKKIKNAVYLTLSSGVGSGRYQNGKLGEKVELGHQPLDVSDDNRLCSCNEQNHAEAYLGTKGLARTYTKVFEIDPSSIGPEEEYSISRKMRDGITKEDKKWIAVLDMYVGHLTLLLRKIWNIYRPELIILGGGIAFGNKSLLNEVHKNMSEPPIELAEVSHNVNLGAAKYAFDRLDK